MSTAPLLACLGLHKLTNVLWLRSGDPVTCSYIVWVLQVLSEAFRDSDPTTPIYFILSAGANVTADVDKLADKHHMERGVTYHDISLGQVGRLFQFGGSCVDPCRWVMWKWNTRMSLFWILVKPEDPVI